ncbi:MAG: hypothetical protein H6912_10935 [Kordiimonadaceae bacterium]|nr:hypothetical protein [Kordiimonadaceae bacterium]
MNEIYTQFISILYGIWRNRKVALAIAWGVSILGWLYVSQIPNQYESKARLHFDSDRVLTPLMSDLTVNNNIYNQILGMRETLLGLDNVKKVILGTNIKNLVSPTGELSDDQLNSLVREIAGNFKIEPESTTLFSMAYSSENPVFAHGVVQGFLDAFMGGQLIDSSGELSGAMSFIEKQLSDLEVKLEAAEKRRSEFEQANMSFLSTSGQSYMQSLSAARQEVSDVQLQIDELKSQKDQIIQYRDELPPFVSSFGAGPISGAQRVTVETRIASMVTQLDELYVRGYKEQHPDVVILQNQIKALQDQLVEEKEGLAKAMNDGDTSALSSMDGLRPNPLFDQLSIKLVDIDGEMAKLEARKAQKETVVSNLLALSQRVPEVEAEETRLNRDYDILKENYNRLLSKREETRMSQVLEDTSQGINYSLIEPATMPTSPASPNRLFLVVVSMVVGIIAGCGVAFIMNQFHSTFSSEQKLRDVFNLPVLGSVSAILSKQDEILRKRSMVASSVMFGGLFVAGVFVYIILERMNASVV